MCTLLQLQSAKGLAANFQSSHVKLSWQQSCAGTVVTHRVECLQTSSLACILYSRGHVYAAQTSFSLAQVARLAKQLPGKDADLRSMAAFLNSKMAEEGDDPGDAPEDEEGELDLT